MKSFFYTISGIILAFPMVTSAQFGGVDTLFFRMLGFINGILVPFVFAIAFLIFIWGVFKYFILGGDNESSREEGKKLILYGIAGFVIMVSVWGIVNLLSFGLGYNNQPLRSIPTVPQFRSGGSGSGQGTSFPSGGSGSGFNTGNAPEPQWRPEPPVNSQPSTDTIGDGVISI